MKRRKVIRLIKTAARNHLLVFRGHALDAMDDDGETRESVAAALQNARSFTLQANDLWRVHGDGLTVIIKVEGTTVIVWTVFVG